MFQFRIKCANWSCILQSKNCIRKCNITSLIRLKGSKCRGGADSLWYLDSYPVRETVTREVSALPSYKSLNIEEHNKTNQWTQF